MHSLFGKLHVTE